MFQIENKIGESMKEEIKEILARLSRYVITPDVRHDFDDLLDYITTLQEENKELNNDIVWWTNRFKAVERDNREYKARIDKAIEFIEENLTFYITIGGTDERKLIGYNKAFDELLKILEGKNE